MCHIFFRIWSGDREDDLQNELQVPAVLHVSKSGHHPHGRDQVHGEQVRTNSQQFQVLGKNSFDQRSGNRKMFENKE